jgi:hypothetical protein
MTLGVTPQSGAETNQACFELKEAPWVFPWGLFQLDYNGEF